MIFLIQINILISVLAQIYDKTFKSSSSKGLLVEIDNEVKIWKK